MPTAPRRRFVFLAVLFLLPLACAEPGPPDEVFPNPFVRGFISTALAGQDAEVPSPGVYLPAVTVTLQDVVSDADVAEGRTDLSGRYSFPGVPPGEYRICWEMRGFVDGCDTLSFEVQDRPMFVPLIRITPDRRSYPRVLQGKVRLRSGALRTLEPLAGINSFAKVRLRRGSNPPEDSAFVNTFGDYVLPIRPGSDDLRLETVVEGLVSSRTLTNEMLQRTGFVHQADFVLRNHAPRPELRTILAGRNVRSAAPGSTIRLEGSGEDIDGDVLQFRWVLPEQSGTLSAVTGPSVDWRLPDAPGLHRVRVHVSDGRGGHSTMEASVTTDLPAIGFSGRVRATDAPAVADATVEVNGATTTTNSRGGFDVRVDESETYVLNITKAGYGLVSRVYLEPVAGAVYTLTRGTTATVDPTQPIEVTDAREYDRCPGPLSSRVAWDSFPEAATPRRIDRFGRVSGVADVSIRERSRILQVDCGPGIRVEIPPNSLVDADGNPPPGMVDVTVHTFDVRSPFGMPGDYTATAASGRGVMESYGAGQVEVWAGGKAYNLRPGAMARVTIPIEPSQLAAPGPEPPRIPLLKYDRSTGIWNERGVLDRVGNAYVGVVDSFSEINSDLVKQNQACIRIHSPPSGTDFTGLPANFRLEATIPLGGGAAPRVIDVEITNDVPYHAIYNLPTNTDVVLVPYDGANDVPYGTFIVNTGGPQNPSTPNRPQYDYQACQGLVTLYDATAPAPGPDAYLHGLYSFGADVIDELADPVNAAAWDAATDEYYAQVDPDSSRTTFNDFRAKHGFPTGEVHGIYANKADLGFGRDMHCVQNPAGDGGDDDVACYVSNYGNQATPDTDDFVDAVNGNGLVATVAMEYSRIEDPSDPSGFSDSDRVVKFFVYNAAGERVKAADLDGRGARPIPHLCLVCHGGSVGGLGITNFPDAQSVKLGSRFIAFDLFAYTFVDGTDPAFDKAAQQGAFHQLNQIVEATSPGSPIEELIDSMYPGGTPPQVENFVVPGWQADAARQAMYLNVLRPTCRMCHASQPQSNLLGRDLRFHEADGLIALGATVPLRVCSQRVMPHALVTHDSMWASISPHQPAQLKAFGDAQVTGGYGPDCADPPIDPPTPAGTPTYDTDLAGLLNTQCASCHTGPKQPVSQTDACNDGFTVMGDLLDLTPAEGYNSLVGVASTELPGMQLVAPGNPNQSYLVHKLENSHLGQGGCGVQMPFGGSLDPGQLTLVRDWITAGAPRN